MDAGLTGATLGADIAGMEGGIDHGFRQGS